jgi:hypothetical protein
MSSVSDQLIEIARRKERLIARAEAQRAAVRAEFRHLQKPLAVVDRGMEVGRFLRAHPLVVGALVGAVTVFRGRGLVSMAGRAWSLWRLWRSLSMWAAR